MTIDKSVLVLGVGPDQGLGVALCKKFAEEGYKVFGCGRSEENMKALEKISTTNGSIQGLVADVTDPDDVTVSYTHLTLPTIYSV